MAEGLKSTLQIVLMPLAVAVVGVVGSLVISSYQSESASRLASAQTEAARERADSDRQIKVLEIFADKITGDETEREMALRLLRALDPEFHQKLASAVAEAEPENSIIAELARNEVARATQRRANQEDASGGTELSQDRKSPAVTSLCDKYGGYTSEEWESRFLHDTQPGTWHVFVASLGKGTDRDGASRVAEDFNHRHPMHRFRVMNTVGANYGNPRYAIVLAEGLTDEDLAREIAKYADKCGIANGAYAYRQGF